MHTSCINSLNSKLQPKKSKISPALISPLLKALKWRPALTEHDQLLSQTENTSVLPWHPFPLSFQSLFHQRNNMRASKFLPLKSYTKTFSDGTPEIQAAVRSHAGVWSRPLPGWWQRPQPPGSAGSHHQTASPASTSQLPASEAQGIGSAQPGSELPWAT